MIVIGYIFITDLGYPYGDVFPTSEAAELATELEPSGKYYTLEKTAEGIMFLRFLYAKTNDIK